jgi:hypothetical protein
MNGSRNTDAAFARRCRPTTVWRAFIVVIGFGAGFSVLGGALGSLIGRLTPTYYRTVFAIGRHEAFDPVEMGIGLGLNQGWGVGLVVGLVVVGVFAWKDYWLDKVALAVAPHVVRRPERTSALQVLVIVLGIFASMFSWLVGMFFGFYDGRLYADQEQDRQRVKYLVEMLDQDGFEQIDISKEARRDIKLIGTVPNPETFDELREQMEREFGTRAVDSMLRGVRVEERKETRPEPRD